MIYDRIFILISLQLGGKYKLNKTNDRKGLALSIVYRVLGVLGITAVFVGILYAMRNILFLPLTTNLMLFCLFVSQVLSLISCTVGLCESLYTSKDNPILLAYPARHSEVFYSKLAVFYIAEFMKNLYFLLPIIIAFGIMLKVTVWYWVFGLVMLVLLPLLATLFGAVVSIPLMYIKKALKKLPFIYVVLILALAVGIFLVAKWLADYLDAHPIRIRALYASFVYRALLFVDSVSNYTLFYRCVTNVMFANKILLNMVILMAVIVTLGAIALLLSRPLFFRMTSMQGSTTKTKIKHTVSKRDRRKSVFATFAKKELLLALRNPGQILSNYALVMVLPCILYILNIIFSTIQLTPTGNVLVFVINLFLCLVMVTASNGQSATSLSVEGSEFVLLKTAPSKTYLIAWTKVLINFIISMLFVILTGVILYLLKSIDGQDALLLIGIVALVDAGHILWSFQIDLCNPQLRDYASSGNLQNNTNISKSIFVGFMVAVIVSLLCVFFYNDNANTYIVKVFGICVAFLVARIFLFSSNLKCHFKDIEF
ncbi:MAG: hypothetical protein PHW00_00345 [Clostridia bacterium]|nr:hypothetical protein [Clostridia bacterium]